MPPPRGRSPAPPLVFRGCIDNANEVRLALKRAVTGVWGAAYRPRDLWHLGLGWHQAAITARSECAHVFAELYRNEDLVCCPNGLSVNSNNKRGAEKEEEWRGYLALMDDDEIAAGDLVLWRHTPPAAAQMMMIPAHALPVEMRPRSALSTLALARLRQAWTERRCACFAKDGSVQLMRFAPRVHGVNGARRARLAEAAPTPARLSHRERRLFGAG